jgi:hypothetical protein
MKNKNKDDKKRDKAATVQKKNHTPDQVTKL